MRPLLACLLLAAAVYADDFGRTLRAAKHDDRTTRRAALAELAAGSVEPKGRGQTRRMIRSLRVYLSPKSLGPDRALAVLALGRLGEESVHERIAEAVAEERDDRVLDAMEQVFAASGEEWHDRLFARFREAEDALEKAACLRMALAVPGKRSREIARIRAGMVDHWAIRATAVEALRRDREKGVAEICIGLLDLDEPGVVAAAIDVLTRRTGKRFGLDVLSWKTWWNTREKVESLEKAIGDGGGEGGETRTVSREERKQPVRSYFFGVPVRGRKVVYVFDVSGSMRSKLPLANAQLLNSVRGLPPQSEFEVVFFNEHVYPWRRRFSRADPVTKEMLARHLGELEIKSYTNLFDSIETALEMGPDEVFVISDGEPNRGRKQLPRDIRRELKELNPRGKVTIHTVSVVRTVDGGEHVELLKGIAEDHGGQAVQRTLY